jgi:hypothetical protein
MGVHVGVGCQAPYEEASEKDPQVLPLNPMNRMTFLEIVGSELFTIPSNRDHEHITGYAHWTQALALPVRVVHNSVAYSRYFIQNSNQNLMIS